MAHGEELLRKQAYALADAVFDDLDEEPYCSVGDSPIEKLFFRAFMVTGWLGRRAHGVWLSHGMQAWASGEKHGAPFGKLMIEPQVQLPGWRVDFMISAWSFGTIHHRTLGKQQGEEGWRKLIVECDGHDFHERDKKQAKRDRSRDRWAADNGYDVYRFTGSEIHNNPMKCADQVFEWGARSFGAW